MKKILATLICAIVLSMTALPAAAQTRTRRYNQTTYSRYDGRYDRYGSRYDGRYRDYRYNNRSIWEKHQDKLTTAGGAVAGALLGGVIGGKKGAIIGAVAGGAGAAVYTYKIRNRGYRRY